MDFTSLLWKISGANVKVMRKCETSQKQYSNIGAVILMTAGIAFCAGTFAAYYFSCNSSNDNKGNIPMALVFGVLWSLLVFCIDRALVVTLQKKKNRNRAWWVLPFISRFLLAALIASMISIPIELFIFEDYIKSSEKLYLSMKDSIYIDKYQGKGAIGFYEDLRNKRDTERSNLSGTIESVRVSIENEKSEIERLGKEKDSPYVYSQKYKTQYDSYVNANNNYESLRSQYYRTNKKVTDAYNKKEQLKKSANLIKSQWVQQKESEIVNHKNILDSLQNVLLTTQKEYEKADSLYKDASGKYTIRFEGFISEVDSNRAEIQKGNSFMRNFDILEWAVSSQNPNNDGRTSSEGLFLWLIRLLFLIIEILPTVVKIATPYGEYDSLMEAIEIKRIKESDITAERFTSDDEDSLPPPVIVTNPEHNL